MDGVPFDACVLLRSFCGSSQVSRGDHVGGQAEFFEQLDFVVADVDFPPSVLEARGGRVFVMVVVPAFTDRQKGNEPVVATVFVGFVVLIAEHVTERVYRPRDVPNGDDANVDAPHD